MSNINQVDTSEFYNHIPTDDEQSLYGVVYSNEDYDLPYDYYDDLYHTFMGSDDEVRDGCWE